MLAGVDHDGSRGADRVGMAGTILGRHRLRGEAGKHGEPQDAPRPQRGTEQTTTNHEAPTAFPFRPDGYAPRDERSINYPASTQVQIREPHQSQRRAPSAPHAPRDSRCRANNAKMRATSRRFVPWDRAAG